MGCNSQKENEVRGAKPTVTNTIFLETFEPEDCGKNTLATFPAIHKVLIKDNKVLAISLDRWDNDPDKMVDITSPQAFRMTYTGLGTPFGLILAVMDAKTLKVTLEFSVIIKTSKEELLERVFLEIWPSSGGFSGNELVQSDLIQKNVHEIRCFRNRVIFGVE